MAITHVNTQTGTQASASSVSASKPTGTASGDLLIAAFTSNSQNCTPPSGWTEMFDEPIDVFRCQVFRKTAGGSEPSSYSFTVPDSAPLALSITALRGIDTSSPVDISPVVESGTTHSEPYTTPSVSGGTAGRLMFLRAARISSSTPVTFTGSGVTELVDVGVFSGGSVSYSAGLYLATSDYSSGGSKSGAAVTASASESHNVVATWAVKASGVPGSMEVSLPLPTVSMEGSWAVPAVLDADLPLPTMDAEGFAGDYEGTLEAEVPIGVDMAAGLEPTGTVAIEMPISIDAHGETRHFSENVMPIEREERWLIPTQDGYRLGVRTGTDLPMRIELPGLGVAFSVITFPLGPMVPAEVQAFDATTTGTVLAPAGEVAASGESLAPQHISHVIAPSASTEAFDVTVISASMPNAGHAVVSIETFSSEFTSAGTTDVPVQVFDATTTGTASALAGEVTASGVAANPSHISHMVTSSVSTQAFDATTTGTVSATSGHASTSVVAFNLGFAPAGPVNVSVSANNATTTGTTSVPAGSASISGTAPAPSHISHVVAPSASIQAFGATASSASMPNAGHAPASVEAFSSQFTPAGPADASVVANGATILVVPSIQAPAGHATATCMNLAEVSAPAEHVAATAAANAASIWDPGNIQAPAGHASTTVNM